MPSSSRGHRRLRALLGVPVIAALTLAGPTTSASAATTPGTPLPRHVFAPYVEMWNGDSLTTLAQQSGARYLTLAFLETTSKTSCTLAWNGDAAQTVASGNYLTDVANLRALGGDIVPSLGGWSADQGGTEIGDSCKDVNAIAAAYEDLVVRYGVSRIDMDIEGRSLTKPDGIDRRNKAIKLLQDWAASTGRTVEIVYTLPTTAQGLGTNELSVLQNAVANGVRIDIVSPMVFDYYDRVTTDMGAAALTAAQGLFDQLHTLLPAKTTAQLWAMIGMTMLPGIDDYPKKTETTYLPDAQKMLTFAQANGLAELSIWALQRDNGACPGVTDSNTCSGIVQNPWDFTHLLTPYTS